MFENARDEREGKVDALRRIGDRRNDIFWLLLGFVHRKSYGDTIFISSNPCDVAYVLVDKIQSLLMIDSRLVNGGAINF